MPVHFHWEQHPVVSVGVDLPKLEGWEPHSARTARTLFLVRRPDSKEKSVDGLFVCLSGFAR